MSLAAEKLSSWVEEAQDAIVAVSEEKHPLLAGVIKTNGLIDVRSSRDGCIVQFLAGTVVSQQLSSQASSTIWSRVCDLADSHGKELKEVFVDTHHDELRDCGISGAKTKAIIGMATACREGQLCDEEMRSADYEQISDTITQLWGFGQWSADMVAMFFAKLPDVWPESDVALIRGLEKLAPDEEPETAARNYSPYRTYLARHVWRAIDTGLIVE